MSLWVFGHHAHFMTSVHVCDFGPQERQLLACESRLVREARQVSFWTVASPKLSQRHWSKTDSVVGKLKNQVLCKTNKEWRTFVAVQNSRGIAGKRRRKCKLPCLPCEDFPKFRSSSKPSCFKLRPVQAFFICALGEENDVVSVAGDTCPNKN